MPLQSYVGKTIKVGDDTAAITDVALVGMKSRRVKGVLQLIKMCKVTLQLNGKTEYLSASIPELEELTNNDTAS